MRISAFVFAAAIALSGAAHAQSSLNILTTDSKTAPRAMTGAASLKEANGVRLYKGSPLKEEPALLGGEPVASTKNCELEIEIRERPWRRLRRLRTQGFYSGVPYPSRGYTQGFYSGKR